jgi:pyruvate formate lyase activating enzyme
MAVARYWHLLADGRIQCDLCPRACKLNVDQSGYCFVRERKQNQLILNTYGFVSSLQVDPIEKKPLFHFLPGSSILSLSTFGCSFGCKFCQNWHMSRVRLPKHALMPVTPQDIATAARKEHCQSVAFTYNEPTISLEYVVDAAIACEAEQIKTVAVSNGYICAEPRKEFFKHMDAANIDLKAITEHFYQKYIHAHLQPVLDTLIYLKKETSVWLEITTLLIPGLNDSDAEIETLTKWIAEHLGADVPLHFSAFFPQWKLKHLSPTPPATLKRAREIAIKNGLQFVYTGHFQDEVAQNTYCPCCRKCVMTRSRMALINSHLDEKGFCGYCHEGKILN